MLRKTGPTAIMMPFESQVMMYLFGRPKNWSPYSPDALPQIANYINVWDVNTVLSPAPDFSARIATRKDVMSDTIPIETDTGIVNVHFGYKADGVEILPGEAFYIAPGDCPTLVLFDPYQNRLVCAHAGRDCLFDRKALCEGVSARTHESVVHAAVHAIGSEPSNLKGFISCGIGPTNFSHTVEGSDSNRLMVDHFLMLGETAVEGESTHGRLDLKEIIRMQLLNLGVFRQNIGMDSIDTFTDREDGELTWWSNRRGDKMQRNGVLVVFNK